MISVENEIDYDFIYIYGMIFSTIFIADLRGKI